jgi:hypothetical protein
MVEAHEEEMRRQRRAEHPSMEYCRSPRISRISTNAPVFHGIKGTAAAYAFRRLRENSWNSWLLFGESTEQQDLSTPGT